MDPKGKYMVGKLDPVLEPMVVQMMLDKPDDPVGFMISWLEKAQKEPISIRYKIYYLRSA